jgi:membrane-bound lytic murein transglycosylase B
MRIAPIALLTAILLTLSACGSNTARNETNAPPEPAEATAETPVPAETRALPAPVGDYRATSLSGDYAGYADTEALVTRLQEQHGYDEAYLNGVFSRVERQQWILDYLNRPKARGKSPPGSWSRYRKKFLTDSRLRKGLEFWDLYEAELERAHGRYGVPPEYVVAIIGVETNYGRNFGSHKVIEALSTLAFDYPRRAEFFTGELEQFLLMAREEGWDPFQPVGSYAGAMGLGQFMPSSFHNYAVDFDGDGVRDLWNPTDAIGSVANYFAGHGWRSGEPVALTARARGQEAGLMEAGYKSRYSPALLEQKGVITSVPVDAESEVSLIRLSTYSGPEYWVGLHNFYVITRYNHSSYYAMAVHQLAQSLANARTQTRGPILSLDNRPQPPVN